MNFRYSHTANIVLGGSGHNGQQGYSFDATAGGNGGQGGKILEQNNITIQNGSYSCVVNGYATYGGADANSSFGSYSSANGSQKVISINGKTIGGNGGNGGNGWLPAQDGWPEEAPTSGSSGTGVGGKGGNGGAKTSGNGGKGSNGGLCAGGGGGGGAGAYASSGSGGAGGTGGSGGIWVTLLS